MELLTEILTQQLAPGITVQDVALILGAILAGIVVSSVVEVALRRMLKVIVAGSVRAAVIHAFHGPLRWGLIVAAAWVGVAVMMRVSGRESATDFQNSIMLASELPLVLWFGLRLIDNLSVIGAAKAAKTASTFDDQLVPILRKSAKAFLIVIGVVMVIQNLGGEVGSLLAGFGIGGAAVALASKDTIANLFGSIVIFVDRPFQIGDWVEIGAQEGTVEEVGLRVTRVRTFANSLITVPNSQLTTTSINNWSRMKKRRITFSVGLTYAASAEDMERAVEALRGVLRDDKRIDQGFWLVNFNEFGPSSLDIFVYCFTVTTDWGEYLQVRQELLLAFMRAIKDLGLEFAFPTSTIHVAGLPNNLPGLPTGTGTAKLPG